MASDGLLVRTTNLFKDSEEQLNTKEKSLLDRLTKDGESSNPYVLAQYQAVISELHLMHTTRSSIVKVLEDTSKGIVGNFR